MTAASFPLRERCATTSSKAVFWLFAKSPVAPESIATRNKMVFALFNSLLKFIFMETLSRSDLQGHGPTSVMTRKARGLFRTRRQNLASPESGGLPALRSEPHAPRFASDAQVWQGLQGVVEAVGKIGGADNQGKLDDLSFIVKLPEVFQSAGADGGGAAGDALGIQDGGFLLRIEQRTALVELQRLDLLGSDPEPLRRSGVGARSILAAVDESGFQIGELFVAGLDGAFVDDRRVQGKEFVQDVRPMRHQRKKVRHLVELLCEGVECGVRRGRGLVFRQRIDSSHETSLDKVMFSWGDRGSVHPICEGERHGFPAAIAGELLRPQRLRAPATQPSICGLLTKKLHGRGLVTTRPEKSGQAWT